MPTAVRWTICLALIAGPAQAQLIMLAEPPREGDCFQISIQTRVAGSLKVQRDGRAVTLAVQAENNHQFSERTLWVDKGLTRRSARLYNVARSRGTIDSQPIERSLGTDRRLIIAQRTGDGLLCFAPSGPLTRHEVEVVSEHFDTLHLSGLLPGHDVRIGDSWKLLSEAVQSLGLFDGLISHDLKGTLLEATEALARIKVEGSARGIEHGALVNLTIAATVEFDRANKLVTALEWTQKDRRDQGPVSPAAEIDTSTILKRSRLEHEPTELSPARLERLPPPLEVPLPWRQISYRDPRGRFRFLHDRDWHVVVQTEHHVVLRLLDRGDFLAQATLTPWRRANGGKHMSPEEFETLIADGRNWKIEQILDRTEIPTETDRWLYRIIARGELDGNKVVQHFYALAFADGSQIIATFTMKPDAAARIGTRDVALVNAIDWLAK